jgi:flavin reductase (DIM6/NTAB) family NADH-FMN oxidoreductase RutF
MEPLTLRLCPRRGGWATPVCSGWASKTVENLRREGQCVLNLPSADLEPIRKVEQVYAR